MSQRGAFRLGLHGTNLCPPPVAVQRQFSRSAVCPKPQRAARQTNVKIIQTSPHAPPAASWDNSRSGQNGRRPAARIQPAGPRSGTLREPAAGTAALPDLLPRAGNPLPATSNQRPEFGKSFVPALNGLLAVSNPFLILFDKPCGSIHPEGVPLNRSPVTKPASPTSVRNTKPIARYLGSSGRTFFSYQS